MTEPHPSKTAHPRPDPASPTLATKDLHTHLIPPGWEDWATKFGGERWPRLVERDACHATIMTGEQFFRDVDDRSWSAPRRIEDMDRLGIGRQALSPPPVMFCYWADARATEAFARMQNENVAGVVGRHPDRFVGMATVPLQDPALAVKELRYCRERLGLRAVEIGSCPAGRDFDDPALFPFFEACAELDVAAFVHPAVPLVGQERLTKYYFPLIVGNPLETALAASKLIYGGVLERLPQLRVCFAHGGGAFPYTVGRIEHGFIARPDLCALENNINPREYLGKFYVDSLVHDADALRLLLKMVGEERIALGSDYPFPLGEAIPGELVHKTPMSDSDKELVFSGSAKEWLGI